MSERGWQALRRNAWRQGSEEALRNIAKVRRAKDHEASGDKEAKISVEYVLLAFP